MTSCLRAVVEDLRVRSKRSRDQLEGNTWPVLAQGLSWQIMIGAGRCSSSAFAVLVGGNNGTQPFGALAPWPNVLFGRNQEDNQPSFPTTRAHHCRDATIV